MMKQIISNEWKSLLRVKAFSYLTYFFIMSLGVVSWLGTVQNKEQDVQQKKATEHVRAQWENIKQMNTHSAAHFGSYAFKPVTPLSSMDDGVSASTGNVIRLEAHVQNETAYSEASQSLSISKFGKLKPSLILQFVIPLFLIFLAFNSVSKEKEQGRLKLLVLQGASLPKLVVAKTIGVWTYGVLLLLFTLVVQILLNLQSISVDYFWRLSLLFFSYCAYYYVVTALTVYFSARLANNTAALSSMIAVWLLWTIFLPKIWGNSVEKIYPLPSREEFKALMAQDRSQGIDGHNPSDKRGKAFEEKILAQYKMDSLSQLPVNFDGMRMQQDEEYGNMVWDRHFGNKYKVLEKQKKTYQYSGIINPFASLQDASMGFSGSDMLHFVNFQLQAEHYRRILIKTLNDKQTYGGSKTGDWGWKENNDFYRSVKDFEYRTPVLKEVWSSYSLNLLTLALWVVFTTILIIFGSKKTTIL
ncbi:hypothetical protein KO02_21920 [Sphingobacterium sp. ML3W]|uniref:DUF3526 domain-containing protein n=1 Tax=Sphingobacterium sp. ML3W TaxID=1538644 RepID=UPI0004F6D938|nr:DUF3526 domain-containing protein [Sphingobacterium sp. ML3W]AIM39044.1 hypothetical protein KO02_21920 [Sphingobacterium sp. ML3W]